MVSWKGQEDGHPRKSGVVPVNNKETRNKGAPETTLPVSTSPTTSPESVSRAM